MRRRSEGEAASGGKMSKYSVFWWESHPDNENDDCRTGFDFDSLEEAIEKFNSDGDRYTAYIEIDGMTDEQHKSLNIPRVRKNPKHVKTRDIDDDSEWRREIANEAGMLHGVEAYNEVMGYD